MHTRFAAIALLFPLAVFAVPAEEEAHALSARLRAEVRTAGALPDLFRLYELRDELPDLGPLARTLDEVTADKAARPDVRAAALELRAHLATAQAQLPLARSFIERVAPVTSWSVIGPFENEGRSGLRAVYGPEKDGYAPAARYPGKEHEVGWRTLPPQLFPMATSTCRRPSHRRTSRRSTQPRWCLRVAPGRSSCTSARAAPRACG